MEKVRFFSFAWETAVAWKKCILLAWYHVPCFLHCPVPKGDLPAGVAHCQPTADKVLLLQGSSTSPERAADLHYMQTSTLIFSVEAAAGVCAPLTEAVAISWWLWWRTRVHAVCALLQLMSKVQQLAVRTQGTWVKVSEFALKWIKIMHKIQSGSVTGLVMPRWIAGTSGGHITPVFRSSLGSWKNQEVGKGKP